MTVRTRLMRYQYRCKDWWHRFPWLDKPGPQDTFTYGPPTPLGPEERTRPPLRP